LLQYSELRVEEETGQERKRLKVKRREPKEKQICATDSSDKNKASLGLIDGPRDLTTTSATPNKIRHRRASTDTLEKHSDFGGDTNELFAPELIFLVPEKFNERDQCSPWVGTVDDKTLQENTSHHLTEVIVLDFDEEVEQEGGEPVGMSVGISQVEHHSAQEMVLSFNI